MTKIPNSHVHKHRLINDIQNAVDRFFPFASVAERRRFRDECGRLQKRLQDINSQRDFFLSFEHLFAKLRNGHTKLKDYPTKRWYGPKELNVRKYRKLWHLFRRGHDLGVVKAIDDHSPDDLLRFHQKRIASASKHYRNHQAKKFLLLADEPRPARITLYSKRRKQLLVVQRKKVRPKVTPTASFRLLPKKIIYIRIPIWRENDPALDRLERKLIQWHQQAPCGVIIDVRGNGGGSTTPAFRLAGHFFKKMTNFGTVVQRVPGEKLRFRTRTLFVEPLQPYFDCPLVILTDIECLSSNEIFIAGMRDNHRATIIGDQTGGSSGNPVFKAFSHGRLWCTIQIATWRYRRLNGKWLEGKGIEPFEKYKRRVKLGWEKVTARQRKNLARKRK